MPLTEASPKTDVPPFELSGDADTGRPRLLIVDDEEASGRLICRVLSDGYETLIASSGEEALAAMPEFQPDLVMLDVIMPGWDGYETCRRIRALKQHHWVKILMISGCAGLKERLRGYEAGADDFVIKPFDNQELRAKVDVFAKLKRVEELDYVKGSLLTLYGHRAQNPLGLIVDLANLLLFDDALSEDARRKISMIYKRSGELYQLVEKTTLFNELKSGADLNRHPGSLKPILINVIRAFRMVAYEKQVNLTLTCPHDVELNVDWQILVEALGFLLENAVKYTREGSEVAITAAVDNEFCHIRLSDEGPGIENDWVDHISNDFAIHKVARHRKSRGLSLLIAKQAVESHGGRIAVDSQAGKGSTFIISLPKHQQPGERPN
jgi:signal transduction histidine kinase